jgi:hypothetical protein
MRRVTLVIFFAFFALVSPVRCFPQDAAITMGSIRGEVFTRDEAGGQAVFPDALVALHGLVVPGAVIQQTRSDARGAYAFDAVPPGKYSVEASAPGLTAALEVDVDAGNQSYLAWGAFLVFGAVASFLTIGLQRRRMASGRPEQYLGMWHKEADNRSSNPLLYLGRHTEFIIRRCFLPYAFLVFAIFHVTNWAFVATTIGANVVWMVALYSYLTFSASQAPKTVETPTIGSPVASS